MKVKRVDSGGMRSEREGRAFRGIRRSLLILGLMLLIPASAQANTYDVNDLGDPGNGVCDGAECTLDEAITAANAFPGTDTIEFSVAGSIGLAGDLPQISEAVTIDGESAPGWAAGAPVVEVNGQGTAFRVLWIGAVPSVTIQGLVLNGMTNVGIETLAGSSNATIRGNFIGTDLSGTAVQPAAGGSIEALHIDGDGHTIGGPAPADRNVISADAVSNVTQVVLDGTNHQLLGNYIGTDKTGTVDLGPSIATSVGLDVEGEGQIIGGSGLGEGNLISGNGNGIFAYPPVPPLNPIEITGNRIGTDEAGTAALGNDLRGVQVQGSGAAAAIQVNGNLISGNDVGVLVDNTIGGQVNDNQIGTDLAGTGSIPNLSEGLYLSTSVSGLQVDGDTVANNGSDGIQADAGSVGNTFSNLSMYDNTGIAIDLDLDGVTANDDQDPDSGANDLQNYPVITAANINGPATDVTGFLNSVPSSNYTLEFYSSATCDGSGNGEGATRLASTALAVDGTGQTGFSLDVGALPPGENQITALATSDATGSTSEFSACTTAMPDVASFDVNDAGDTGDGTCDVTCTLRDAILNSNTNPGAETITFSTISGAIQPDTTVLPVITGPTIIDGETAVGWSVGNPVLELNGDLSGGGWGLEFSSTSSPSTVQGLVIDQWGNDGGIHVAAGATDTTIRGNFIGTDAAGTAVPAPPNNPVGIQVSGSGTTIGGSTPADRNVISANDNEGVVLGGDGPGNQVLGNYIGTDKTGTAALGNGVSGASAVYLPSGFAAASIGGGAPGEGNLISGNGGVGVDIQTSGASVTDNRIGTNAAGTAGLGNFAEGIMIQTPNTGVLVTGNLVSGNGGTGIRLSNTGPHQLSGNQVGTDLAGTSGIPNAVSGISLENTVDVESTGDTVAFNTGPGVNVEGAAATGNSIRQLSAFGNTGIGIDLGADGVTANDPTDPDIGANELQNYPVISGASANGPATDVTGVLDSVASTNYEVDFYSSPVCDGSGNGEGRTYLTDLPLTTNGSGQAAFQVDVGSVPAGEQITAVATNVATGSSSEFSACATVVADETAFPVNLLTDTGDGTCDGTCTLRDAILGANSSPGPETITFTVQGTISPTAPLPSFTDSGVIDGESAPGWTSASPKVVLDGTVAGAGAGLTLTSSGTVQGLVINDFNGPGIAVDSSSSGATIRDNFIGTNPAGTAAGPGNADGIVVEGDSTTIGGLSSPDRNVISGNTGAGINFQGSADSGSIGNLVGTGPNGNAAVPNGADGIIVQGGSTGLLSTGDRIAFNQGPGIRNGDPTSTGNTFDDVSMVSNSALGIDLGSVGVLANDPLDADTGANSQQNYPVISAAETTATTTVIKGALGSTPGTAFEIDYYASATCDPSGNGEGDTLVAEENISTDGSGAATFNKAIGALPAGKLQVTAVATNVATGSSSEFSPCALAQAAVVTPPPPPPPEGLVPTAGKTALGALVSGKVKVKVPGGKFKLLKADQLIPVGSIVDATKGRVRLTTETGDGKGTQTAEFYAGAFKLLQRKGQTLVTLKLTGGKSRKVCRKRKKKGKKGNKGRALDLPAFTSIAPARASASRSSRTLRRLWGNGKGRYRTKGNRGSGTVRGTIWLTADRCDGTFFKVRRGVVQVKDFGTKGSKLLKKGQRYLAR